MKLLAIPTDAVQALACLLLLAAPLAFQAKVKARQQTFAEKLSSRVRYFDSGGRSLAECIVDLSYRYRLPAALEYVDRDAATRPLRVRLAGKKLSGVIAALAVASPGYAADFAQGTVDIYSPSGRADTRNLLNTIIPRFQMDKGGVGFASFNLVGSLQFIYHPDWAFAGDFAGSPQGPITLHLSGKRVYEILNAIVSQTGSDMWMVAVPPTALHAFQERPMWRVYGLDPLYKEMVLQDLGALFPPTRPQPSKRGSAEFELHKLFTDTLLLLPIQASESHGTE